MRLTRRSTFILCAGAAAGAGLGFGSASASALADEIERFTGGSDVTTGLVSLTAPEIAENGNTVPIRIAAPGALAVAVFAEGNPLLRVATFRFGALNPKGVASTRIRLAKTQNVIAIAEMADGTFRQASAFVKVTVGGCGG
ncbi:thiosulfate oxidation carrier protein SoxY [Sedimentitalea sp. XS_ASV28]|uniref:thiosulfate oxidation carrier protein SoxY n=1 Tax=Sedimentitalea sp. XS_ASV28 TaxID=3241296 RepID=UPI003516845B